MDETWPLFSDGQVLLTMLKKPERALKESKLESFQNTLSSILKERKREMHHTMCRYQRVESFDLLKKLPAQDYQQ